MTMKDEPIFYIIYSPETCNFFLRSTPYAPEYLKKGYYLSALPIEPCNIKFQGSWWDCRNVFQSLNAFVYN